MTTTFRASIPYFGSTLWWTKATAQEVLVLRKNETFQRRSQRNRTIICNSQGKQTLSIPLQGGRHQSGPITTVKISYEEDWQKQHLLSIKAAYGSAAYYFAFEDELNGLYSKKPDTLWDWNLACIEWVKSIINVGFEIAFTEEWIDKIDKNNVPLSENERLSKYQQVFSDRLGWKSNLSILDLIMCQGPASTQYLRMAVD